MLIKKAVYDECKACGRSKGLLQEEVFGCDGCRKRIEFPGKGGKNHHDYLQLTIFRNPNDSSSEHMHFCSWRCVFKALLTVKSNYFISLPFLHYEGDTVAGQSANDFKRIIRKALR